QLSSTLQRLHPDFEYIIFNDKSAQEFIAAHFPSAVINAFVRVREAAQRADLFRLAYLSVAGGYYVDADNRCLSRIDLDGPNHAGLCLYQEDYGTIGNDFLGTIAGHPVVQRALDLAVTAVNRGDADMLWLSTGPGLITRAFAQTIAASDLKASDWLGSTTVMDLWEVQRFVGLHCVLPYKKTKRHWTRLIFKQAAPSVLARKGRAETRSEDM